MHRLRDIGQLKSYVRQAEVLIGRVPVDIANKVGVDIRLAIKGIVTPKAPPKPKRKPTLVVDDDGDYVYDEEFEQETESLDARFAEVFIAEE